MSDKIDASAMWIAGWQAGALWADPVLFEGRSLEELAEIKWNELAALPTAQTGQT